MSRPLLSWNVAVKGNIEDIDPCRVMNKGHPVCLSRMDIAEKDKRCARMVELEDHLRHRELLKVDHHRPPLHPQCSDAPWVTLGFAHISQRLTHKQSIGTHECSYVKKER